jgi:hypothetical protein
LKNNNKYTINDNKSDIEILKEEINNEKKTIFNSEDNLVEEKELNNNFSLNSQPTSLSDSSLFSLSDSSFVYKNVISKHFPFPHHPTD